MAFFEKRKRHGKRNLDAGFPSEDRYETEQDLRALVKAKKIQKDLPRHQGVKNLARERLATLRRKGGKRQGMIERHDNTITPGRHHFGEVREKKYPQENVD